MSRIILIGFGVVLALVAVLYRARKSDTYTKDPSVIAEGQRLFGIHCLSCHGIQQDGIGPPLGGVTHLRSRGDLEIFVRNPAQAIHAGDIRGRALLARYKQTMPPYDWMDQPSLDAILEYIHHETEIRGIENFNVLDGIDTTTSLSGKLARPVVKSDLRIGLDELIQIPRLAYSTPDLGIATLRPHPSGDGRLFVSDQGGVIYELDQGKLTTFMDMRSHVKEFSIGPGLATGLGSFDFHPEYLSNGLIYITHAEKFTGQTADYNISDSLLAEVQWVLGEWKMDDVSRRDFKGTYRELLRLHAPTFGHGAQDLAFVPGLAKDHPEYALLYWGFGDGGSNNIKKPELGHNPRSFLGTILRIDPKGNNSRNGKYGIPHDNPFASHTSDGNVVKEIYAYGFRNPHRMAWDESNRNRMIVTDIGESNLEEINIVEKGRDYGWPNREGTFGISTLRDPKSVYDLPPAEAALYSDPFVQYDHTVGYAISGGYVYDGDIQSLKNKYIFGDIVNGKLFYVNIDHQLTDSTIYELTIDKNGKSTNLRDMTGIKRLHLRIGYDRFSKKLFVMTKADGKIYRITSSGK